jgi:DNA polymerase-3 subunit delta'
MFEILGQSTACQFFEQAIAHGLCGNYFLHGFYGVGKRTLTQQIIQQVWGENPPDVLVIEPTYLLQNQLIAQSKAQANKLDLGNAKALIRREQIDELLEWLDFTPVRSPKKAVVLYHADRLHPSSANAILKAMETDKAIFFLISDLPDKVLPTLASRCQCVPFATLGKADLKTLLDRLGVGYSPKLLDMAQGSIGRALSLKSQLSELPQELFSLPQNIFEAIAFAKAITELSHAQQLALADWWQSERQTLEWFRAWESLKQQLSANPVLVWENMGLWLLGF